MAIHPLPVILEDEEEARLIEKLEPPKTIVVRYGYTKMVGEFPYDGDQIMGCGSKLVVRTPRGIELGEMLTTTCSNAGCGKSISRKQMLEYIDNSGGKQYPFTTDGKVMRIATAEDMSEGSRIDADKPKHIKAAKQAIIDFDLPMKLIEVEEMFSRDRIVFYFTSEDRIDFRELVRRLAAELRVRIEMRQVGARDEARLTADYERCGQHCCCKQFLKVLKPVSMRSAKVQKATLDPAKISGRCGRLMCCLRYEDETYEDLRRRLPHRNSRVSTDEGTGTVVNTQILTQLVLVELDHNRQRFAFPVENIEKLTGEAAKRPTPPPAVFNKGRGKGNGGSGNGEAGDAGKKGGEAVRSEPRRPKPGKPLREEEIESREGKQAVDVAEPEAKPATKPKPEAPKAEGETGSGDQEQPRRRRRRRRRRGGKGRGTGGSGGGGDAGGGGGG
ncbi:MAG: regulatory iron-sulfur-containing complex subunit RicT [Phycisphaeraceae bacterium]